MGTMVPIVPIETGPTNTNENAADDAPAPYQINEADDTVPNSKNSNSTPAPAPALAPAAPAFPDDQRLATTAPLQDANDNDDDSYAEDNIPILYGRDKLIDNDSSSDEEDGPPRRSANKYRVAESDTDTDAEDDTAPAPVTQAPQETPTPLPPLKEVFSFGQYLRPFHPPRGTLLDPTSSDDDDAGEPPPMALHQIERNGYSSADTDDDEDEDAVAEVPAPGYTQRPLVDSSDDEDEDATSVEPPPPPPPPPPPLTSLLPPPGFPPLPPPGLTAIESDSDSDSEGESPATATATARHSLECLLKCFTPTFFKRTAHTTSSSSHSKSKPKCTPPSFY